MLKKKYNPWEQLPQPRPFPAWLGILLTPLMYFLFFVVLILVAPIGLLLRAVFC